MAKHKIKGVYKHNFCYTADLVDESTKKESSVQWNLDTGARLSAEVGDTWDDEKEEIIKGKSTGTGQIVL